jgi:hypothetical protein
LSLLGRHTHRLSIRDRLDDRWERWLEVDIASWEFVDWDLGIQVIWKPILDVISFIPAHGAVAVRIQ